MRFRSSPHEIRGSIVPLMTPFTADGAVDHESLANLVEWQLANGTHGVSIGGSTGEPGAQSVDERVAAIATVT
ncbi:MAG: dihydrodipicolinate synthase family protein, partial [Pseudolysinimonas sp.]